MLNRYYSEIAAILYYVHAIVHFESAQVSMCGCPGEMEIERKPEWKRLKYSVYTTVYNNSLTNCKSLTGGDVIEL